MESITQPWPWYIAGPLLGLSVPLLLLLAGKTLGISSSFRHMCTIAAPKSKLDYLRTNNWRKESWSLVFVGGILLGGLVATRFLSTGPVALLPEHYYSAGGIALLFIGGILVGFGTRYADGCTSGHTIMGLSNLKWPSLVASVSFFAGGLLMAWLINPLLGW